LSARKAGATTISAFIEIVKGTEEEEKKSCAFLHGG
jgi:hypothetical protein